MVDESNNNEGTSAEGQKEIMIPKARFDEVNNKLKELSTWKAQQEKTIADAEAKKLAEQGEYQKIAEKATKEKADIEAKYNRTNKLSAIKLSAIKAGAVDADDVVRFIDLEEVKLSEDGSIDQASIDNVIGKLKEGKKYLFGSGSVNIGGSGGAPQGGAIVYHRLSDLENSIYFEKHKDDILKAQKEGRIIK